MQNILIADDHSIVRAGLKLLINSSIRDVSIDEAEDGEAVIKKMKSAPFDLLILDINMPHTESFSLTAYLLKEYPGLKIIIFTMNQEVFFAKRFLKIGAHGYLNKYSKEAEIKYAIQKVLSGKRYISDNLAEILSGELTRKKKDNPFEDLSDREFEVVLQMLKGSSVSEIANTLSLHKSTVGTHKTRILDKLKISNTVELINLARLYEII
jgi:two-component system invasion response regulator UvrY